MNGSGHAFLIMPPLLTLFLCPGLPLSSSVLAIPMPKQKGRRAAWEEAFNYQLLMDEL